MLIEEQIKRNKIMQDRLRKYDIVRWGNELIRELISIKEEQEKFSIKLLNSELKEKIIEHYKQSKRRLILLDYDGTLVPFSRMPMRAKPDADLLDLLK
ncbi:MAG: hypothetical protein ABIL43_03105 [candidate division WOR-3 bacterium]